MKNNIKQTINIDISVEFGDELADLKKNINPISQQEKIDECCGDFDWVKLLDPEKIPENYEKYKFRTIGQIQDDLKKQENYNPHQLDVLVTHFFLYEINLQREKLKLPKLHLDPLLTEGAWIHAEYLAKNDTNGHYGDNEKYYHERAYNITGGDWAETSLYLKGDTFRIDMDMVKQTPLFHTGENNSIYSQNGSTKMITKLWLNSDGHRPTITKRKDIIPTHLGVGIGKDQDGKITRIVVWTAKEVIVD